MWETGPDSVKWRESITPQEYHNHDASSLWIFHFTIDWKNGEWHRSLQMRQKPEMDGTDIGDYYYYISFLENKNLQKHVLVYKWCHLFNLFACPSPHPSFVCQEPAANNLVVCSQQTTITSASVCVCSIVSNIWGWLLCEILIENCFCGDQIGFMHFVMKVNSLL